MGVPNHAYLLNGPSRPMGTMSFGKSNPFFADNDLGDGSTIELIKTVGETDSPFGIVRIRWIAWNEFEFEGVPRERGDMKSVK